MKYSVAILLCLLFPVAACAGGRGSRRTEGGGLLQGIKTGGPATSMLDPKQMGVGSYDAMCVRMPGMRSMEISSRQDAQIRARVAMGLAAGGFGLGAILILSTSNRHFLGLVWASGE